MKYFLISIIALLSSCTYSITMVHTEGTASDVVEEDQKASPVVSPTVTVPVKAI